MSDKLPFIEPIKIKFDVKQGDFIRAGEASSKIKKTLLQLGFSGKLIRCAAIATYEAEMNIVIHSWGGKIEAEICPDRITIVAKDIGPGIADISKAMEEGYSTAPEHVREMGFGAGMGLPNMRNCSNEFNIESALDRGTKIVMVIGKPRSGAE